MSLLKEIFKETTLYDWILFLTLLLFSLSGFVYLKRLAPSGNSVTIEVNGKTIYRLSLNQDRVVDVHGPIGITTVEVRDGRVRVVESPGPRKLCIRQGWTDKGALICLPNRVVVTVGGDAGREIDAISG